MTRIPAILQQDFENLIEGIRHTYEMSIKYVTPPEPVHVGKQNLAGHHSTLDDLCIQLGTSLESFQQVYIGQGSATYQARATASLQDLQMLRDHFAQASVLHNTMALNFDVATEAKVALAALLVGLAITLGVLIASAGTTSPVTVPAAAFEVAGGAVSIGLMTEAEAAALVAIMGLMWAALPEALLAGLAGLTVFEVLEHVTLNFAKKPRSDTYNQVEDKQWKWILQQIARKLGRPLTKAEQRRLHNEISKQGYSVEEIVEIGISMFGP